ncbi:hypothetical protein [Gorillibacterium massiliense]|uniref:hypothetical protein n=1 Tax=Gorillibacterium massiliense TaxID=1280390 RepID=UPI0004B366E2|nr:hypothetical protein [Gorillibacterium massiliense]
MLEPNVKEVFKNIDFIKRYKGLSEKYQFDYKDSFENYDANLVLGILNQLGYSFRFDKKEKFFRLIEIVSEDKFQFTISLKYGALEFIWSAWKNTNLLIGGTWGIIKEQLDAQENDKIKKPIFRNYNELREILAEALLIYGDFKHEFKALS